MGAAKVNTECLVCGQALELGDDLMLGELIDCQVCGTEFEISATDPVQLIEAPMVGEDWGE